MTESRLRRTQTTSKESAKNKKGLPSQIAFPSKSHFLQWFAGKSKMPEDPIGFEFIFGSPSIAQIERQLSTRTPSALDLLGDLTRITPVEY